MLHKQSFANFLQNRCSQKFRNIQGKHLRWTLFSVKFQTWRPVTLLKTDSGTDVSSEYCRIFKNSFFYRTPLVAASEWFTECDLQKIEIFLGHYFERTYLLYYLQYWTATLEEPRQQLLDDIRGLNKLKRNWKQFNDVHFGSICHNFGQWISFNNTQCHACCKVGDLI